MSALEDLLSDTADHFERELATDQAAQAELDAAVQAGQQPHVVRMLHGMVRVSLFMAVGRPETLPSG